MNLVNVLAEKRNLEKQIKSIGLELRRMPKKNIYCTRNGSAYKWYETNGKISKYIPKTKRQYAEKLAKKKYLLAKKKDLQQELKALDAYLKHHKTTGGVAMELLSHPGYAELLTPYVNTVNQEVQKWIKAPYVCNNLFPEGLIYKTSAGIYVRSKSEALIVMLLHMKNIPFRYECLLKLGDSVYYPDFTIKHPKTGKIFYYEHFGRMDDADYMKGVFPKLQVYANYGIIQGVNLIATFETKDHPLETDMVEKIIDYYFS